MKLSFDARKWFASYWQSVTIYVGLLAAFGLLLWWQLGTLTRGYSVHELQALGSSLSLPHIFHHPVNAPYNVLAYGIGAIGNHSLYLLRITSMVFGLATLSAFYWTVRYWHGLRAAVLGSIAFGCSAWFLHAARLGTPDVTFFLVFVLTGIGLWLRHQPKALILLAGFVLAVALVYIPGMLWLVLAGVAWQWKTIDGIFKRRLWTVSLGALIVLAALAPLGLAIYHTPALAKELAGLPLVGWPQPLTALKHLAEVPLAFLWQSPSNPEVWLARLPVLDAFLVAMLGLGGYVYARNFGLRRTLLQVGIVILGAVLVSLGGDVTISVLVPFVYIVIAAGIDFMLSRWWKVFPRNTIAQGVGLGLVSVAVLASCTYSLRHYFVAWPNAPEAKTVFIVPSSDTMKK